VTTGLSTGGSSGSEEVPFRFYGVVDDFLGEAVELFLDRREAERVVRDWDRDEPDQAGLLRVEPVELVISAN